MKVFRDFPHLWVLVWAFSLSTVSSNTVGSIIESIGLDPDEEPTIDDIYILEDIFLLETTNVSRFRQLVSELSLVTESDLTYLQMTHGFTSIENYINPASSEVIVALAKQVVKNNQPGRNKFTYSAVHSKQVEYAGRYNGLLGNSKYGLVWSNSIKLSTPVSINSYYLSHDTERYRLLLGHYQLLSGYGLSFWRSSPPYKGFDSITSLPRFNSRITPFRSVNNQWSLHGIGVKTQLTNWNLFLGFSSRPVSVRVVNERTFLSGSNWNNGNTREILGFLQVVYISPAVQLGSIFSLSYYSDTENHESRKVPSIFYRIGEKNLFLFGEHSPGSSFSGIHGFNINVGSIKYLFSYRHLPGKSLGKRSNPMSEWKGSIDNETGVFQGISSRIGNHSVSLFADLFQQGENHLYEFPGYGNEVGIRYRFTGEYSQWRLQYKTETKTEYNGLKYTSPTDLSGSRSTASIKYNRRIHSLFTSHLDIVHVLHDSDRLTSGLGIQIGLRRQLDIVQWEWSMVLTRVDDYPSRVYFWDVNLPGEMRSFSMSQSGVSSAFKVVRKFSIGGDIGYRVRAIKYVDNRKKITVQSSLIFSAVI